MTTDSVTACSEALGVILTLIADLEHLPQAGRLTFCTRNWTGLSQDPWIVEATTGYRLELPQIPQQQWTTQQRNLTLPEEDLISEEIQKLLTKQVIKQVKRTPGQFLSQLFLVPKKDGTHRPVINLKPLNQFIQRQKFKMEGARTIRDIIQRNDWMISIDLKDAYLSVPIWEEDRRFLRFSWGTYLYEFQCLPFGLSSAPRVFTKLLD